jgi:hypothetical protein
MTQIIQNLLLYHPKNYLNDSDEDLELIPAFVYLNNYSSIIKILSLYTPVPGGKLQRC